MIILCYSVVDQSVSATASNFFFIETYYGISYFDLCASFINSFTNNGDNGGGKGHSRPTPRAAMIIFL